MLHHALLLSVIVGILHAAVPVIPTVPFARSQVQGRDTDVVTNSIQNLELDIAYGLNGQAVFSPFSIASLLNVLYEAAGKGSTNKQQLKVALHYERSVDSAIYDKYAQILQSLLSANGVVVNVASRIFLHRGYARDLVPKFEMTAKNYFDTEIELLEISKTPALAARRINRWISSTTNNKITNLISSLQPHSLFVAVNTVYFNGPWKMPFDPRNTKVDKFEVTPGQTVQVSYMINIITTNYIHHEFKPINRSPIGVSMIELPYKGDQFSMYIVLPDEGKTVDDLQSHGGPLSEPEVINNFIRGMKNETVTVRLPRMKLSTKLDLRNVLQDIGVKDMFSHTTSDFTNMVTNDAWVDTIMHETVIEVTETGTEAAAATAATLNRFGSSIRFDASRPFIFFIIEKTHGVPLFYGRVTRPTSP